MYTDQYHKGLSLLGLRADKLSRPPVDKHIVFVALRIYNANHGCGGLSIAVAQRVTGVLSDVVAFVPEGYVNLNSTSHITSLIFQGMLLFCNISLEKHHRKRYNDA